MTVYIFSALSDRFFLASECVAFNPYRVFFLLLLQRNAAPNAPFGAARWKTMGCDKKGTLEGQLPGEGSSGVAGSIRLLHEGDDGHWCLLTSRFCSIVWQLSTGTLSRISMTTFLYADFSTVIDDAPLAHGTPAPNNATDATAVSSSGSANVLAIVFRVFRAIGFLRREIDTLADIGRPPTLRAFCGGGFVGQKVSLLTQGSGWSGKELEHYS